MNNNKIVLKNVSKKFGKHTALKNVSLEINNGMFGLIGPNGAGKTTMMRLMTTLEEQSKGSISVNGFDTIKDKLEIRKIIGFLPQDFEVYPELKAIEFLNYIGNLNKINNKDTVVNSLLKKVNLYSDKDRKIGGFSGGMRRRLGIAASLIKNPKILIVDEPTAGLDPEERIRFRSMIVELSQDRIVILSTHIVEDISASCEQIGLLVRGELGYVGRPYDFIDTVANKSWEIMIKDKSELVDIKEKYQIIAITQMKKETSIRVISESKPSINSVLVNPNLEDAYLYYMKDQ
ncbi:ABC transporter ATP-binding protein [Tissierella sp. MB52-C2]|uniref:ABC transporter ATP-binding protein n=1 Tax=Tissierella sp. MB52-C2 TaxID=3070999 RepID=UPI00280BEC36|nr:ABC transporter ATP-binding protein [Tissierella sp. MB52-C2]WMM26424.1 ABC transporter ATP-binding protein [Tissierella sp. MB52-C2]